MGNAAMADKRRGLNSLTDGAAKEAPALFPCQAQAIDWRTQPAARALGREPWPDEALAAAPQALSSGQSPAQERSTRDPWQPVGWAAYRWTLAGGLRLATASGARVTTLASRLVARERAKALRGNPGAVRVLQKIRKPDLRK
jgi:hypothetical protein